MCLRRGGSAAIEKDPRHSKKVKVVIGARRAQPNPRLGVNVIHPSFHPQPTEKKSCSKLKLIQIENAQTTMLLWFQVFVTLCSIFLMKIDKEAQATMKMQETDCQHLTFIQVLRHGT